MKRLFAIVFVLAALGARAQEIETSTIVVPIVGNIPGIGVRWVTSLELRNNTGAPVEVWMLLPTTAEAPAFNRTLGPNETVVMSDVIAQAFGTTTALSPLKVITTGRHSVTVRANVYPVRADGQVLAAEPIAVDDRPSIYPVRSLPGLAFSDDFRTNIGLVNLSEDKSATFVLALQRLAGRNVAVSRITLPPESLSHTSIQSLFPLITSGNDFTIVVETASPDTFVYASVIDNNTTAARFIRPNVGVPVDVTP
ncbi:MAG TPA: hypothetical protein VGR95_16510 [Thermoanaerobaculia bacterium]|nr:hypothetical protein [Thermoanaerobaculia bacterium]